MVATSFTSRGSTSQDVSTRPLQTKIEINFPAQKPGQTPGLVNSYTTGDQIKGTVTITVEHDTRFDEVEIVLQGTSHTSVARVGCPGRTESRQVFLELRQPIEETEYPTPRLLEARREYIFSFTFVVPDKLLPGVCTHFRSNHQIHQAHTLLPPTSGDPKMAGDARSSIDDMASDTNRISYMVLAAVMERSSRNNHQVKALANAAKQIRILPIVEEEPPVNTVDYAYYCTRKEKSVKRGFFCGKLGRLVASSSQPKPIRLSTPSCRPRDTVSTVATLRLRFDPVGNEQPPRLGSMISKLKASSFYSATPWEEFPCQSGNIPFSQVGQALFNESIPLSTMCVASVHWQKHCILSDADSRDLSNTTLSEYSSGLPVSFSEGTYYTASVVVPITLPETKAFVPTFHSCLVSRIYSLDLSLTYSTPGANFLAPTIHLRLPVQITTQPKYDSLEPFIEG